MLKNLLILATALGSLVSAEMLQNPSKDQKGSTDNQLITFKQQDGKTCTIRISTESTFSITKKIYGKEDSEHLEFMQILTLVGLVEYNHEIPIEDSLRIMPVDKKNGLFLPAHIDNLTQETGTDVNQALAYYYGKDDYSSVTIEFRMLMANKDYMYMAKDLKEAVTTLQIKILSFPYLYKESRLGFIYGISSTDMIRTSKDDNRIFFGNINQNIKYDLGSTENNLGETILQVSDFKMDSSINKLFPNYQTSAPEHDILLLGYENNKQPTVNVEIQLACDVNPLPLIPPIASAPNSTSTPTSSTKEVENNIQAKETEDPNSAAKNTLLTVALLFGASAYFIGITV